MKRRTKIHRRKKICSFFLFFSVLILIIYFGSYGSLNSKNEYSSDTSILPAFESEDDLLIDKIYTFHEERLTLSITNLSFQKEYVYYIKVALATSTNQSEMKIDLIDPAGDVYHIFQSEEPMVYEEYFQIPFGTALSGIYTVNFTKIEGPNANFHIVISKGDLCYREFVAGENNFAFEVKKLENISEGKKYQPIYELKDQWRYHVYICRVSPITIIDSNNISFNHIIIDPSEERITFPIFQNVSLELVWNPLTYSFATACEGDYQFNFTFYQDPLFINVMILILDEGEFASGADEEPVNQTTDIEPGLIISFPFEAQVGIWIGIGSLILIGLIVIVYITRRKNV